jgi:putative ABC transport system permease protein
MTLAILGVALGVTVVVAVDLANERAQRSFHLSMERVSGRATHQIVGGPNGLEEQVYARLRVDAGFRDMAPVIEGFGRTHGETLHLLGIDPLVEHNFRLHFDNVEGIPLRQLLLQTNTVVMASKTAKRIGLDPGDEFEFEINGRRQPVLLVGLLHADPGSDTAIDGLLIADIATAQEITGQFGRLSWIDVIIPRSREQEMTEEISRLLPQGAIVVPAALRTQAMSQMIEAFQVNLSAMSLLALIVGMFLIYNTMVFAVLQRRSLFATLRVLGETRQQVFWMILMEAGTLGAVGTLLGLVAGVILSYGLTTLVSRTINDLYFVLAVTDIPLTARPLLKGLVLGIGATLLAASAPAMETSWTTPHSALNRSSLEDHVRRVSPRLALLGLGCSLAAMLVLWFTARDLLSGFVALFLLLLGFTLMTPVVVAAMIRLVLLSTRRSVGIQSRLAIRGINAALSRTSVAIAALMLAVSTAVGVGVMVDSFRANVAVWLESTLRADIYISSPRLRSTRSYVHIDPDIIPRLRRIEGITNITRGCSTTLESAEGLTKVSVVDMDGVQKPQYLLKEGNPDQVWKAFMGNEAVLVSEPLAFHRHLKLGDNMTLRTETGDRAFRIAGIYYDYESGPGKVLLNRGLYKRYWSDPVIDALGLYIRSGVSVSNVLRQIQNVLGSEQHLIVRSNKELREASMEIFDRTFTITRVLRLITIIVAIVGIFSAMMALQLERGREMAILRAVGFTPGQIWRLVTLQTGSMGMMAGLLSLPVGLVLANLLINVINRRSFGWSMQFAIEPKILWQAVVMAVLAATIAGLYPGWKMSHVTPAALLREE